MRVDKLNDAQFFNAMNEYVEIRTGWGEEEEMRKELKDGTFFDVMQGFDCTVYINGHIGAPVYNKLEDLENGSGDGDAYFTALANAVEYVKEYCDEDKFPKTLEELHRILDDDGVAFCEDGEMGWIDAAPNVEAKPVIDPSLVINNLNKSLEGFSSALERDDINWMDSSTYPMYCPKYDRTVILMELAFENNTNMQIPIGWYSGEPNDESTKEYANGDIAGWDEW
jgi:hypothetical protein